MVWPPNNHGHVRKYKTLQTHADVALTLSERHLHGHGSGGERQASAQDYGGRAAASCHRHHRIGHHSQRRHNLDIGAG